MGLRPTPQFLVGFGGFAAKTNQKKLLGAAKPPRTPPPEADFASAVYYRMGGFGSFAAKTTHIQNYPQCSTPLAPRC
jgi:hypothetical protein